MFLRSSRRLQNIWTALRGCILAAGLVAWGRGAEPQELPAGGPATPIESFGQFWTVDTQVSHPVKAEGDVLYYDPEWRLLWVRSDGNTIFVPLGKVLPNIRSGDRIEVEGKVRPADGFSADLARFQVLPAAAPTPPVQLALRSEEEAKKNSAAMARYEGLVAHQVDLDSNHVLLEVVVNGRTIFTRIWVSGTQPITQFEGCIVKVLGLYIPKFDPAGRIVAHEAWVPATDNVQMISSLEEDPRFSLPITSMQSWNALPTDRQIRIRGTVHGVAPGQGITLRDDEGQVYVRTEQSTPLKIGDHVEAVGYPASTGGHWTLEEGLFRITGAPSASSSGGSRGVVKKLRLAGQVMEMSPVEAARGHPVHLWAAVMWSSPNTSFFYVSDSSGGVRVECQAGSQTPPVGVGVDITGVTGSGRFSPVVLASSWTDLAKVGLPVARRITLEQAFTGVEESQWVSLRGFVREARPDGIWTRLQITSSAGEFSAFVPPNEAVGAVEGALVWVSGICSAVANQRRQLIGIELWVPNSGCIQIEEPPPPDAFSVPAQSIASLREYSTLESMNRRVRLTGVVTHQLRGEYLFIQDGDEGLLVLSRSEVPVSRGDRVEVVGFPGRDGARVVLREGVYRRSGVGAEPSPLVLGTTRAVDEDLDARLVKVKATVIDAVNRADERVYVAQAGPVIFEAHRDLSSAQREPVLPVGAEVAFTGVYRVEHDEYQKARGFHLQLRAPSDIQILARPSWWTAEHAIGFAAVLGLVAVTGFGWVGALRRRVQQQTAQLREQLEKESNLEARYRDIVQNASDLIFTVDRTGRFSSLNPAGERTFGYTQEEALGLKIQELLAPEDQDVELPFLDPNLKAGRGALTSQTRFRARDGRVIWIEISARKTYDAAGQVYVLGVGRDITERKHIEEELKRARDAAEANTKAKSAFLANMSHEIRTPMNGVIGMSNLLLDTPLSDVQRDFAETIRNSADALLTVLNDILDFSKIEAGKLHFEVLDFNLRETVDQTIELLAPRAAGKNLELAAFIPTDLPCFVRGDSGRLRQVLLNLVGNAIKFTERGEVVVHVTAEEKTDRMVRIRFDVTDTGIGLSPEVNARLFQPFSQADGSTTRKFGGTGLGLAISKQIVELMGGKIGVRSEVGRGSTFWFTLQLERQPDRPSRSPLAAADALRGRRALIVDDNQTNRRIVEHYLTAWSVVNDQVNDGPSALEAMRKAANAGTPYDIAVIDFEMPGMNGIVLAGAVRADPGLPGVRMVLCTSWDYAFDRAELERVGIVHLMMKPIRQPELLHALLIAIGSNSGEFVEIAGRPAARPRVPSRAPVTAGARELRVLMAEDNAVNQRVTLLQLQKLGYRADMASTGLEVLEALERVEYDVILMDCNMPEMDGFEATRRIRRHGRHNGVKIIAMTANAMQGDRERCLTCGMDDYISKPTRLEELRDVITRCVAAPVSTGGS